MSLENPSQDSLFTPQGCLMRDLIMLISQSGQLD